MSKETRITSRTFVLTAVIGSLLVMTAVTANSLRASKQTSAATEDAVAAVSSFYLEAMADRRAKTITNLINNNFDEMEKAVSFIADEKLSSQEDLRNAIGKVKSLLGLGRFALVDKDNVVYTQFTTYTGGSRHAFLADEQLSGRDISTVSIYGSSKQLCLAIPTPGLSIMGKSFKACFVQLDINDIVNLLAFDDQGRTYFALYSKNGNNLSGTEMGPIISNHNLFDAIEGLVANDVWQTICQSFIHEESGSITFSSGGFEETLSYVPIEGTGWEMAVLIRESVIQDQIRDISERNLENSRNQMVFTLVSVLGLAFVLLFQVRKASKARIEEEQQTSRALRSMANTDSLTGVRNKHAYSEQEAIVNSQIQTGELRELAVVVGDLNGLKHVNDTQGHAAGDQLIKDACAMLCEQFAHGAVFRVGGDEFAVLLMGKGYETRDQAIATFNQQVEANITKDAVVVSIGYATLEPGDQQLADVFARADKMMYERKRELKEMGATTSRV